MYATETYCNYQYISTKVIKMKAMYFLCLSFIKIKGVHLYGYHQCYIFGLGYCKARHQSRVLSLVQKGLVQMLQWKQVVVVKLLLVTMKEILHHLILKTHQCMFNNKLFEVWYCKYTKWFSEYDWNWVRPDMLGPQVAHACCNLILVFRFQFPSITWRLWVRFYWGRTKDYLRGRSSMIIFHDYISYLYDIGSCVARMHVLWYDFYLW